MKTTLIDKDLTLAVEDAIPASPVYTPEEILALAVCASPNGSTDPGDLALLHAADHPAVASVDVAVLQTMILGPLLGVSREPGEMKQHVSFTPSADLAIRDARAGRCQAAFLVNPTRLDQLIQVSQEGQVMPPKATYFYPKLPSGLVVNCL